MAATLLALLATNRLDEDPPHRLRRRGKEMAPAVPMPLTASDQPQPGLMHQRCGLQRLARRLVSHLVRRQLAQLVIDQRQQFLGGLGIAGLGSLEYASRVAHALNETGAKYLPQKIGKVE